MVESVVSAKLQQEPGTPPELVQLQCERIASLAWRALALNGLGRRVIRERVHAGRLDRESPEVENAMERIAKAVTRDRAPVKQPDREPPISRSALKRFTRLMRVLAEQPDRAPPEEPDRLAEDDPHLQIDEVNQQEIWDAIAELLRAQEKRFLDLVPEMFPDTQNTHLIRQVIGTIMDSQRRPTRHTECPPAMQKMIRMEIGSRFRHLQYRILTSRDLTYIRDNQKRLEYLPHDEQTLRHIQALWERFTTSNAAFGSLSHATMGTATRMFTQSGFPEGWEPTPVEREAYQQAYARYGMDQTYQSPAEIYRSLLLEQDPANGRVVTIGTPDRQNICVVRLPPQEEQGRQAYAERNKALFHRRGGVWMPLMEDQLKEHYGSLAEISMIAASNRGMSYSLLHQLRSEFAQCDVVIAEHFGIVGDQEMVNMGSRTLFENLQASLVYSYPDIVARELDPGKPPVTRPLAWYVRAAPSQRFVHALLNQLQSQAVQSFALHPPEEA